MTLLWQAVDTEGNVLPGLPAGNVVAQLQGWVEGKADDAILLPIPEGAECQAFVRRTTKMGGTTDTGYQPFGEGLSVLALSWAKNGHEKWVWLFEDGTVAETDDDPGERKWGWEDFLADVRRIVAETV